MLSIYPNSMTKALPSSVFEFLKQLKKHNNRDWFNTHKDLYIQQQEEVLRFADLLLIELNKHDVIETESGKKSLHRIYRDIRFSKDKTPYNTHWGGSFKRASKKRRGSYYFHLQPGNSFIAGGFWGPNPADLKRIRDEIAYDPTPLRKILTNKSFKNNFGNLKGEQIKTSPKGFDSKDPAIDLLRYKQFLLIHHFTDKEVLAASFSKQTSNIFKTMRPFLDYMSEVLTTDLNGEAI